MLKADADLSAISCKAKAAVTKSKGGAGKSVIHADSIKLVMAGTGCEDAKKVEQVMIANDSVFLSLYACSLC